MSTNVSSWKANETWCAGMGLESIAGDETLRPASARPCRWLSRLCAHPTWFARHSGHSFFPRFESWPKSVATFARHTSSPAGTPGDALLQFSTHGAVQLTCRATIPQTNARRVLRGRGKATCSSVEVRKIERLGKALASDARHFLRPTTKRQMHTHSSAAAELSNFLAGCNATAQRPTAPAQRTNPATGAHPAAPVQKTNPATGASHATAAARPVAAPSAVPAAVRPQNNVVRGGIARDTLIASTAEMIVASFTKETDFKDGRGGRYSMFQKRVMNELDLDLATGDPVKNIINSILDDGYEKFTAARLATTPETPVAASTPVTASTSGAARPGYHAVTDLL